MQLMTNTKARIISSTPLQHRADTLRSIGQKAHDLTARIQYLNVKGKEMAEMIKNAPPGASSRLDYLYKQLTVAN
jgi:hypothetical protein